MPVVSHLRTVTSATPEDVRRASVALGGVLLALLSLCASPSRAESPVKVDWNKGRLSVAAENAELSQILREVALQTGIEIRGPQDIGQRVSMHFSDVSLEKGLKALLDGVDYAVLGDISSPERARAAHVVVFGLLASDSNRNGASNATTGDVPVSRASRLHRRRLAKARGAVQGKPGSEGDEPNQEELATAVEAAAARGDLDALSKAVQKSDPTVRTEAFEKLSKLDPQAAMDALSSVLNSDQPAERLQALQLLDQSERADKDAVVSAMGQALSADDPSIKDYAIQALARRAGSQEIDLLRQALGDPDPAVRLMVLESVGQEPGSLPLLQQALNDGDPSVSAAASQLLKAANQGSQPPQ